MKAEDLKLINSKKDEYAKKKGHSDWAEFLTEMFFSGKANELDFHLKEVFKEVKKAKAN
ncbi:hypothetical protein [Sphingobacterium faecium]|uniref:hypothetical protein n=1 Tax=Sphingobacterium faecium TaxID=34087 RepID=UPI00246910A5|nr:hypothetical protein [Sphingobacterium faecium]MDH5825786.1 hypothetical protein [Sphingobacterium faecium]